MKQNKINTYAAMFLITLIGAGASMMIIHTAAIAQTNSDNYYNSLNNEAFGTTTPAHLHSAKKKN